MRTERQAIIDYAIPFQAVAKRTFTEVKPNWRKELKVDELIPQLIHLEKLGYFHSHPQFGDKRGTPSLSKPDRESMQETEIEVVMAIIAGKRRAWWRPSGKELSGTLEGYNIRIAGFRKMENGKIEKCRITCPYAVGFDWAFYDRAH